MLIDLFYGLALATGLEHTIPKLLSPPKLDEPHVLLALVILALIMGVSDWVIYHLLVTEVKYHGISRLLLDIIFPILIFVLFMLSNELLYFLICFAGYCALTLLYSLRYHKEGYEMPTRIWLPMLIYMFIGILVIIMLGRKWLDCLDSFELSWMLLFIVGVPWLRCNFSLVQERLRSES
jgi:hypothetical protein